VTFVGLIRIEVVSGESPICIKSFYKLILTQGDGNKTMKRILALIMTIACFCTTGINVMAQAQAVLNTKKGVIVVKGNAGLDYSGRDVLVMAADKDKSLEEVTAEDIVYIGSSKVDGYGSYRHKFSVEYDDPAKLNIYVKEGNKNLTDTLVSAELDTVLDMNFDYSDTDKSITINVDNVYWDSDKILLVIASYDENEKLCAVQKIDFEFDYFANQNSYKIPFDINGGQKIKVFLWENINLMTPVDDYKEKQIVTKQEIDGVAVPFGSALDIYNSETIENTAVKLFSNLDSTSEDTKDIYKLYDDGYYLESLILFRNYMIDRMRAIDYTDSIDNRAWYKSEGGNGQHTDSMKVLCGKMSASDYNAKYKKPTNNASYFQKDYGGYFDTFDTKKDSSIRWLEIPTWISDAVEAPNDAKYYDASTIYPMICLYACTGDTLYLERYLQILNDYSCNYVDSVNSLVDGMSEEDGKYYQKYVDSRVWKYELGGYNAAARLETAGTAARITAGLITMCKALPSDSIENQYTDDFYMDMDSAVYSDKLEDEAYDLVDPVRFANICYQLSVNEFFRLSSYLDMGAIPNQLTNGLTGLMKYLCLFKDFTCCNQYEDVIIESLNESFDKFNQPDGGYLEISGGYNSGDYTLKKNITDWVQSIVPEYAESLKLSKSNLYFERMREQFTSPINLMSNYGNGTNSGTPAYWKKATEAAKLDEERENLQNNQYSSVYLPYSGYGSMRSDWSSDALYLSFFNYNKRNSGHNMTGTNAVLNLTAYKRTLLLSGGTHDYGTVDSLPENAVDLKDKYSELNSYLGETSTRKWSTVMVNDKSQADKQYEFNDDGTFSTNNNWGTALSSVDNNILEARWLSGDRFDFAEGSWTGGYSLVDRDESIQKVQYKQYTDTGAIEKDAEHQRQIIFVKEAGIWIVNDTMKNTMEGANKYTQMWHFPGYDENKQNIYTGFKNEQVIVDSDNNITYTNDTEGPNIFIKSFSPKELSYKKYYGNYEKGEVGIGWFRGGSNIAMNGFAPKVDLHIEWSDEKMGDKTQIVTILAPSKNTQNPMTFCTDSSNGDTVDFAAEFANGTKIRYMSCADAKAFVVDEIKTNAKSLLIVEKGTEKYGVVMDAQSIAYNGNSSQYIGSFEFEINDNIDFISEIKIPEKFEWNETGTGYAPLYE